MSQSNLSDSLDKGIFSKGIYLENLGITIPWELDCDQLKNYKPSGIKVQSKRRNVMTWDSVKILNGILTSINYECSKPIMPKKGYKKIITLTCPITSEDAKKLNIFFNRYSASSVVDKRDASNICMWSINDCIVVLASHKKYGHLLNIQKSQ